MKENSNKHVGKKVIEQDKQVEDLEDLEKIAEIVKNKNRGFRRVTPLASSENKKTPGKQDKAPAAFKGPNHSNISQPPSIPVSENKKFCHFLE